MVALRHCFIAVTLALVLAFSGSALAANDDGPSLDFENIGDHRVTSQEGIVAADHRYASEAGAEILAAGGNAADAGVVAMLTLGVANPFSSGLGGGGFCLYREADTQQTTVLDFRETAPAKAHRDMYVVDGEVDHSLSRWGGLAIATPGEPAGLWALHGRYGNLEWGDVVDPALRLADQGMPVGHTLGRHLQTLADDIEERPELAALFQDENGELLETGDLMVRDDLVKALTLLRDEGVRPFYVGEIADAVAAAAQRHDGILSTDDLAGYAVKEREPIVGQFQNHQIYSMPPPSSGGIALIQAFNTLSHFETGELDDAAYLHLVIESLKHAFADRAEWLGDTDFVDVPTDKLLSEQYAAELAARIDADSVLDIDEYGHTAPDTEQNGTSHLSVVDGDDNMLSCTTTINTRFGSMVVVPEYGIILNNEMADFTAEPGEPNIYGLIGNEQNAIEGGKRPLSSMSPTLVLEDGEPAMSLGGSGGPMIISGVYTTILHSLLMHDDPLDSVISPRFHHQWIPETLGVEIDDLPYVSGLKERGHDVEVRRIYSNVQFIWRPDQVWHGVSDPRKGGMPAAAAPIDESNDSRDSSDSNDQ